MPPAPRGGIPDPELFPEKPPLPIDPVVIDCIFAGLIDEDEISAAISRIDRALYEESFPIPNPDWPAVPRPPF